MKKRIFAVLLAVLMLLPACSDFLLGDTFTSESLSQSSIGSSNEEENSVQGGGSSSGKEENSSQGGNSSSGEEGNGSQEGGNSSSGDNQDQQHIDENDDGICDDCKTSVLVDFDFIAVNDLHGKFADTEENEGVDELSTYIKQTRQGNENTVVFSSGDMWQGTSESNLTKGNIITEWMNELDFLSMTLGNHEYDWGEDYIVNNLELAEFPFLAINVYSNATNQRADYCQPSVTFEKNGVKIGIIGAIGDCHSSISGEHSSGFYFKTGSALTALVQEEADRLRSEGVDFIVYSIHDDDSAYDVSLSKGYVDMVFEGHTHQDYVAKDSAGVYHLQGGGDNDGISHAEVAINSVTGSYKITEAEFVSTSEYARLADDPIVNNLMAKYAQQIAVANKVLGQNDRYRSSSQILQKCADLYYEAGLERWGSQYDIVLGGGFMSARSPYDLQAGTVTYGDLQSILPFDNQLVLCSIRGDKLRSKFFETTNSRYYISYGAYGESVKANIQNNKTYYVITDTYSSTYSSNGLTEIARYDENVFARDLLAKYIEAGGFGSAITTTIEYTSIPKIHEIGNALNDGETTTEVYYVKGTVISVTNTMYGNFTIEDEDGNTVYVFGVYDKNNNRYDAMSNPPVVGDTVVLQSPIQKYVYNGITTIELYHATLWSIE